MRPDRINALLRERVTTLVEAALEKRPGGRLKLAKDMDVGDGTLGRIMYGDGNPTVSTLAKIAEYFRTEAWLLIRPHDLGADTDSTFSKLRSMATPRSAAALDAINAAAQSGQLTEADLLLLRQIAERFMGPPP